MNEARVCGPHSLWLALNDGTAKRVAVRVLLAGPIFGPLTDPTYFASVTLDPTCGTVVWPNGADFVAEALHGLDTERAAESAA